jgi:hypothetical protein
VSKKVIVYHSEYGCDSGCCGHVVEVQDESGKSIDSKFEFAHPRDDDMKKFARDLIEETFGAEHVADLDWDNCQIKEW